LIDIRILRGDEAHHRIDELATVLHDCVTKGASVSFMNPFTMAEAIEFYTEIADAVSRKEIILFAALESDQAVGTCQLIPAKKPNQTHRADLAKLLVHSNHRNKGIGASLLAAADQEVKRRGLKLVTLDTALNTAERLYERAGYQRAGVIPNYALWPDGGYCDTVYFYKWFD
jgi:ribosomal protein S18 acetylase RimI-like enzyme